MTAAMLWNFLLLRHIQANLTKFACSAQPSRARVDVSTHVLYL